VKPRSPLERERRRVSLSLGAIMIAGNTLAAA
jgi:hypothetical protein